MMKNENEIWNRHPDIRRNLKVDSEVIFKLISKFINQNETEEESLKKTFLEIQGSASIATFHSLKAHLLLATNTGSIFYLNDLKNKCFIFFNKLLFYK